MPDEFAFETALATAQGVIDTLDRRDFGRPETLARVTYAILDAIHSVKNSSYATDWRVEVVAALPAVSYRPEA